MNSRLKKHILSPRLSVLITSLAAALVLVSCAYRGDAWFSECANPVKAPAAGGEHGAKNSFPLTGPIEINVLDAVLLALENNRALRLQRFAPAISRTAEQAAGAAFDPVLSASVSGSRSRTASDVTSRSMGGDVGVSKTFSPGTTLDASVEVDRSQSHAAGESHSTRAGVSLTQPVLRGAGSAVNLASIRQARLDTLVSAYELRGFAEALVEDVERVYWDYVLAARQVDIFNNSLTLARSQIKETGEKIRVGKLAEIEMFAAKAEVALRQEDLINAKSAVQKNRLKLLRLLSPPGEGMWDRKVIPLGDPVIPEVELGKVEEHVRIAMKKRPDLNQARLRKKRGELEVVKTKNGLLPRLDLFVNLGKSGYAESFGDALSDVDGKMYDYSAGINFEIPFGNRAAHAGHRAAMLGRKRAEEAEENLAQLAQVDVRSAFIEVSRARALVDATTATHKLQTEKLRAETEKFRVGRSTTFLVAQAQRDLVASEVSKISAVIEHLKALVSLYRIEGTLLEKRGISAPGGNPVEAEE